MCDFGPHGSQPPTGREHLTELLFGPGVVSRNPPCSPPSPRGAQVCDGSFQSISFPAQHASVLDCGSSIPYGEGRGELGLSNEGAEVNHDSLRQAELAQFPQIVYLQLCFICDGADVQLPLGELGGDGPQGEEGLQYQPGSYPK